ncbi:CopG family antitoxin [Kitasatospora sp. NPDC093806]|uniref:CopG family antitoxin n=1 Tax=Kitasatospora sp. NPDC093806 TaxID=3155075 RepID=UPI003449C6DB
MTDNGADLEALAEYYETHELTEDEIMAAEPVEPVPVESVMITTSLRLPKPVMDEVRRRAQARGVKPTAIMREWIEAAVADQDVVVPLSVITAAVAEYQHRKAS